MQLIQLMDKIMFSSPPSRLGPIADRGIELTPNNVTEQLVPGTCFIAYLFIIYVHCV